MFAGSSGSGMGFDQSKALEASFKEFLSRPENAAVVEKQQRKELRQSLKLQERMQLEDLREAVLGADFESQRAIAPFLATPCLRRIIQTFANDARGDFSEWAANPRVIEMLAAAKKLLDEGRMSEEEMEHVLLAQLKDPGHDAHVEFEKKSRRVARLPTDALVGALNEHLTERRRGNDLYRAGKFPEARRAYERAAAVVEFVEGLSSTDQAEVIVNRVAVYNNLAALHLEEKEYGAALGYCAKVLELAPANPKALQRRAKALAGRHDYAEAEATVNRLAGVLGANAPDVLSLRADVQRARRRGAASERGAFAGKLPAGAATGVVSANRTALAAT